MDFAVTTDGIIYAATEMAGAFRSDDDGATWSPLAPLPPDVQLRGIAVTPEGVLYAGTTAGIFRTRDGATWSALGLEHLYITTLTVDARGRIYAGAPGWQGGIYRSDDGFQFYRVLPALNPRDFIITFLSTWKDDVWMGTHADDTWLGHGGGESWGWVGSFYEVPGYEPPVRHLLATPQGTLLAAYFGGLLRSDDQGASWKPVTRGIGAVRLTLLPDGRPVALMESGVALVSPDDGNSWIPMTTPLHAELVSFTATRGGRLLAGSWERLYRTR